MKFILFIALAALPFAVQAKPADNLGYFSWQEGGRDSIICGASDAKHGSKGNCVRPGPKDLSELYCDPKFSPGSRKDGVVYKAWDETCKRYEKSGHAEVVAGRLTEYFAWHEGAADSIRCVQVPKDQGNPGKCIYPGPKSLKELYCDAKFSAQSGKKVNPDFCREKQVWHPRHDEDDGEEVSPDSGVTGGHQDAGNQDDSIPVDLP
ncbi:MAG: hypothetical protein ACXWQO_04710 [Bdellovibrionota bacterium]